MQKFKYGCDAGSLLIGNKEFRINIPNGYGDGFHTAIVLERGCCIEDDISEIMITRNFLTSINGEFNLYSYDCLSKDELDNSVLTTIKGRYGIYACDGTVIFEEWS